MNLSFELCHRLWVMGFPQSRKAGCRYFVTPEIVVLAEDLGVLRMPNGDYVDWSDFVLIPTIEHLRDYLQDSLSEVRRMENPSDPNRTFLAISRSVFAEDGSAIRAFGGSIEEALSELVILTRVTP